MKNNSYRILKLQSGEELITRIAGRKHDKLIIERPMVFKSSTITDPYGRAKEITVLKNWLLYASHEQTTIPIDFVVSFLKPDMDVLELYSLEKKKDDVQNRQKKNRIIKDPRGPIYEKKKDKFDGTEEIENMMNMFGKFNDHPDMIDRIMNDIENMNPDELEELKDESNEEFENFITMTLFLPPDALLSLIDSGLVEEDQIKNIIDVLNNNKPSNDWYGNESDDPKDHGNNWRDWSPFPDDYLGDFGP